MGNSSERGRGTRRVCVGLRHLPVDHVEPAGPDRARAHTALAAIVHHICRMPEFTHAATAFVSNLRRTNIFHTCNDDIFMGRTDDVLMHIRNDDIPMGRTDDVLMHTCRTRAHGPHTSMLKRCHHSNFNLIPHACQTCLGVQAAFCLLL